MHKITITTDDKTIEVRDQYPMIDMSEEHDTSILFGCRDGACGACMIKVIDGAKNLTSMGEDEKDFLATMAAEPEERLACQCKVLGDVKIEVSE